MKMNGQIECTTDCVHCVSYYRCTSEMKLDEHTRDFWLNEEKKADEYEEPEEVNEYDEENEETDDEVDKEKYDIKKHGAVIGIRIYYVNDRIPMADIKTAFVL